MSFVPGTVISFTEKDNVQGSSGLYDLDEAGKGKRSWRRSSQPSHRLQKGQDDERLNTDWLEETRVLLSTSGRAVSKD